MMGGMDALPLTDRTRITRLPDRQVVDRQVLHELLDAGLVAHVGVVRDGVPVILPVGYARDGDSLLLHGSTGGGLLRQAAAGLPVTVTVTLLDGLVYARSLFDSSMNYRCAMVIGTATPVTGPDKLAAMRLLSEHLMPGRWAEVREPTKRELAATLVLRLPLAEASVKLRAAGAEGEPDDGESREVWAGVLPLRTVAGQPEPDSDVPAGVPVPASLDRARRRHLGA
jgi:nitroimidazol reductase NimA-like FMN-containing flavoprotein (pyridoxamine 5'-phosphate oxidase superfamily)